MLSHALDHAEQVNDWKFLELWVDPIVFPPRILMLIGNKEGTYSIYDPIHQYKSVFTSASYDEAHSWLLEDEYERVDGRLLADEVI